jgi:hypothetical protein
VGLKTIAMFGSIVLDKVRMVLSIGGVKYIILSWLSNHLLIILFCPTMVEICPVLFRVSIGMGFAAVSKCLQCSTCLTENGV